MVWDLILYELIWKKPILWIIEEIRENISSQFGQAGIFGRYYLYFPEFFLGFSVLLLFAMVVYFTNNSKSVGKPLILQTSLMCANILLYLFLLYFNISYVDVSFCEGMYVRDWFGTLFVLLVITASGFFCLLAGAYGVKQNIVEHEIIWLFMFVLSGSVLIIFSNDFLTLYLGVELQSLCLYILASSKMNSTFSTEAGLKYFVLGAFASSLFLFGTSIVYGSTGTINFTDLGLLVGLYGVDTLLLQGFWLGNLFVLLGIIFKVGGAPFHFWLPDVYEGSSMLITGFFSIIPKISMFFFLYKNVLEFTFMSNFLSLSLLNLVAILSIMIGSIGALVQSKVKRLLSYSAIGHTGFLLIGLSSATIEGFVSVFVYILVYVFTLLSVFGAFIGLINYKGSSGIKYIGNLKYIYQDNMLVGVILLVSFFSLAGVPPLSGFISKAYVFLSAILQESYGLALMGIILSVIGGSYYLRCVRGISFIQNKNKWMCFVGYTRWEACIVVVGFIFNLSFIVFVNDILQIIYNIQLQII